MSDCNGSSPGPALRLLGQPTVWLDARPAHRLERRDAALLAWLATRGPTPRPHLAALLWSDVAPSAAARNLRQRLFRLRRAVGAELVTGQAALALAPGVDHDLGDWATRLDADPDALGGEVLGELAFDEGDPLGEWVQALREQFRRLRRQLLAEAAERYARQGRIAAALPLAERLAADDPTAEHAHRRVMRLHYLRGDAAAALRAYARCAEELQRQLDVQPGGETRALAEIVRRGGALEGAPAPPPVAVLRPPRLVGRAEDWRAIDQAQGRGQTVLLIGEPGIGKTRLLADRVAAQQGGAVLAGASAGDASVPHATLTRLLRALMGRFTTPLPAWASEEFALLLPELGQGRAGTLQPLRLRQALAAAVAAWQAAGLVQVAVDDLQFADADSLDALLALATPGPEDRAGPHWLLACRGAEQPAAVRAWVDAQDSPPLAVLTLAPLRPQAVAELLASLALPSLDDPSWAPLLHRHTGGNPLFVVETLLALLAGGTPQPSERLPVPRQIGVLLERRLSQVGPVAHKLAQLAALAGADFSVALAGGVLGQHALDLAAPWRELEDAGIMDAQGFVHDLLREAALRTVPALIVRELHRQIAAAASAQGAPSGRVAEHAWLGQDWAAAAPACAAAAAEAARAGSAAAELLWWDRCADCHERLNAAAAAFDARCQAARVALVVEPGPVVQVRIERLSASALDDLQRLRAGVLATHRVGQAALYDEMHTLACDALARVDRCRDDARAVPPGLELQALVHMAAALVMSGRAAQAVALVERARPLAEQTEDTRLQREFWSTAAYTLSNADRRRAGAAAMEQAIGLSEALGDGADAMTNLHNLAGALALFGQAERALEAARRAEAWRERLGPGDGVTLWHSRLMLGLVCLRSGHYAQALEVLPAALEGFRAGAAPLWQATAENVLATTWLTLGQTARARQTLSPLAESMAAATALRRQLVECRLEHLARRPVRERLARARADLRPQANAMDRMGFDLGVAELCPDADAMALCRDVAQEAAALELAALELSAYLRQAAVLTLLQWHTEAGEAARAAQAMLHAGLTPFDITRPQAEWLVACALRAAGDPAGADAALGRANALLCVEASEQVPETFREAFLARQPVHRAIVAAGRALGLRPPT